MKTHLNTLFVTQDGAYLKLDGAAVDVRIEKESKLRSVDFSTGIARAGRRWRWTSWRNSGRCWRTAWHFLCSIGNN